MDLTPPAREALYVIIGWHAGSGRWPSRLEVALALGITLTAASRRVNVLERGGHVDCAGPGGRGGRRIVGARRDGREPQARVRRSPRPQPPPIDRPPTPRQLYALSVIRRLGASQGYPPTVREVGAALGMSSTNAVADLLTSLERKGRIRRTPGLSRSIVVVEGAA